MAFPDLFKLEKLIIFSYPDSKRWTPKESFEAMFNPESFSQTFANSYAPAAGVGNPTEGATFNRILSTDLQLKLLLDGTNVGQYGLSSLLGSTATVEQQVNKFLDVAYRIDGLIHEPRYLKVIWGVLDFPCRLRSVTVTYTSFDRSGLPLRAELDIDLMADEDPDNQLTRMSLSSPDVTHRRQVKSGDTLPLLTKEIYGDNRYYVEVARANNLNHFRTLRQGRSLSFPPLAK